LPPQPGLGGIGYWDARTFRSTAVARYLHRFASDLSIRFEL
jgi:hypothetical protein